MLYTKEDTIYLGILQHTDKFIPIRQKLSKDDEYIINKEQLPIEHAKSIALKVETMCHLMEIYPIYKSIWLKIITNWIILLRLSDSLERNVLNNITGWHRQIPTVRTFKSTQQT